MNGLGAEVSTSTVRLPRFNCYRNVTIHFVQVQNGYRLF